MVKSSVEGIVAVHSCQSQMLQKKVDTHTLEFVPQVWKLSLLEMFWYWSLTLKIEHTQLQKYMQFTHVNNFVYFIQTEQFTTIYTGLATVILSLHGQFHLLTMTFLVQQSRQLLVSVWDKRKELLYADGSACMAQQNNPHPRVHGQWH